MTQPMSVQLEALTAYARAADAISDGMTAIRAHLLAADVTDDAFGLLAEAREAAEVYRTRTDDGLTVLSDGRDVFSDIAVDMRQVRANYQGADDFSKGLTGGGGG